MTAEREIDLTSQITRVELDILGVEDRLERLPALIEKKKRAPGDIDKAEARLEALAAILKTLRWVEKNKPEFVRWKRAETAAKMRGENAAG
jgi:hypothetical protein